MTPPKRWPWLLLAVVVGAVAVALLAGLHEREQTAERAESQATLFATELRDSVREITVFGNTVPERSLTTALRPVIASTAAASAERLDRLDAILGEDPRIDELRRQLIEIRRLSATMKGPVAFSAQLTEASDDMARNADAIARSEHARAALIGRESMAGSALVVLLAVGFVVFVLQRSQRLLLAAGRRQAEQLRELADGDPLTGLANRRRLAADLARLARHIRADEPVQVMICDLDGFKALNDSLGHEAGDELLIRFADRLVDAVGDAGAVYRLGGDEFCVLSRPGLDIAGPVRLALSGTGDDPVRGSAGTALWPTDAPTAREVMRCADERMYAAKDARRGGRAA
jgi:diguanylate cyclase (GGDEF)-like protein